MLYVTGERGAMGGGGILGTALLAAALSGACDDPVNSGALLDDDSTVTSGPAGAPADDGGARRLGDAGPRVPDGGPATAVALAEKLFREAQPGLLASCGGASCHEAGTRAPDYLAPPDPYASLRAFDAAQSPDKKFIVADPLTSRLFTKGPHTGPALPQPDGTGNLGDKVKTWLDAEAAALVGAKLPSTGPAVVAEGANAIDVGAAGKGIAGARITFDAKLAGGLLLLSNVKLVAGPSAAVHVVHPIFLDVPADPKSQPIEDPADSDSNIDDTAASGQAVSLGPGTVILAGFAWQSTDRLAIEFAKIEPGTVAPDAGAGGGACKNVQGFQSIAGDFMGQGISPNCTAACHKQGGNGDGALDLDALAQNPPDYDAACAQALTRVDLKNKANSPLILHPTCQMGSHPGGTVSDVPKFTSDVMTWLAGE